MKTLKQWLKQIEQAHPKSIELGLERISQAKKRLDVTFTCPVITVAGTNGKGSTVSILSHCLHEAGYRVGHTLSPHLYRFNERLQINLQPIDDDTLCSAFEVVEQIVGDISLSYFEFTSIAFFWMLSQANCDCVILEVGLGGRLDATNVIDTDIAVITAIDFDHQRFLGNTLEKIAYEKSGIMRQEKPVIIGYANPQAILIEQAKKKCATTYVRGVDFDIDNQPLTWDFQAGKYSLHALPKPSLLIDNAATALMTLSVLKARLPKALDAIARGLQGVKLNGRCERLVLSPRLEIILDVGHNAACARNLVAFLQSLPKVNKTIALFSALADKAIPSIVDALKPEVDTWYIAPLNTERGVALATLQAALTDCNTITFDSITEAVNHCRQWQETSERERLIIFGSFHTVADCVEAGILELTLRETVES